MGTKQTESQVVNLDQINANELPELQGWKEKQEKLVKDNPFIEITDSKTYSEAKKRRTNLVKGRTEIQGQDKIVASKIKEFRAKVGNATKELIEISIPHEEKQQTEVKRYEAKKEQERLEKSRIEEERVKSIKKEIETIFNSWKITISNYNFKTISDVNIVEVLSEIDAEKFEEFAPDFNEKTRLLTQLFSEKKATLTTAEKQRLESLKLAEERKKFAEEQRIAKEKAEQEEKERTEKQALIDAENNKKQAEIERKELEIKEEQERLQKIERERLKKQQDEEKERAEKEKKELDEKLEKLRVEKEKREEEKRKKRIESLKPDKEKLSKFIESIQTTIDVPDLKDEKLKSFIVYANTEIADLKKNLNEFLKNLN